MKLKALFCNKQQLRKDIFRFAPLWAIYLIGGLLVMLTRLAYSEGAQAAYELSSTMGPFSVINLIYAALTAQMLFGDLFKSRLCNALHALPMRRETWFSTHIIAGVLFSVVPHLIAIVFLMPMLGQFGWVALAWLAAMLMEYLFFFGVAVFCVFCTGNRFAMVAVYAIINFLSIIVYWFVTVMYQPLLYGVTVSETPFTLFCPVVNMAGNTQMLRFTWSYPISDPYSSSLAVWEGRYVYQGVGEGWGYLGICAGIGVVLLVLALLLYRRRKLECAGEFVAEEKMKPAFAVIFALCAGGVVAAFGQSTGLTDGYLAFFVVGLVVGWFGGQMLLRRTVRVFQGKTFAHLAILGLSLALTLGLTAWDPAGITRYVPKQENIQSVEFTQGFLYSYNNADIETADATTIEEIVQIHKKALEERDQFSGSYRSFTIRYTLKSGRQVSRSYKVYTQSRTWMKIQNLYKKPETLLGETGWVAWCQSVKTVHFNGYEVQTYAQKYNESVVAVKISAYTMKNELLMALWADAQEGHLENANLAGKDYSNWVGIERSTEDGYRDWADIYITPQSKNCQEWIKRYEAALKSLEA